jgi:hypothetical protein
MVEIVLNLRGRMINVSSGDMSLTMVAVLRIESSTPSIKTQFPAGTSSISNRYLKNFL